MSHLWSRSSPPPGGWTLERFDNMRLLQTGIGADATIRCRDHSWNVHHTIVCGASKSLRYAFDVTAQHGFNRIVADGEPQIIYGLIFWLYTKNLHAMFLTSDGDSLMRCVNLWMAARSYEIRSLQVACRWQIKNLLRQSVVGTQYIWCRGHKSLSDFPQVANLFISSSTIPELEAIYPVLVFVYHHQLTSIEKLFVSFVKDTHYWTVYNPYFTQMMEIVPRFGQDVANSINQLEDGCFLPDYKPQVCSRCGMEPFNTERSHYALVRNRGDEPEAVCYGCYTGMPPPNNNGGNGVDEDDDSVIYE